MKNLVKLIVLSTLLSYSNHSAAQSAKGGDTEKEEEKKRALKLNWLSIGPGFDFNGKKVVDGNLGFNYNFQPRFGGLFQAGFISSKEWKGTYFPLLYNRRFYQINLGYGILRKNAKVLQSAFIGPAYILGALNIDPSLYPEGQGYTRFGIQGNATMAYTPIKDVGVGLEVFACYNSKYSFAGLRLAFVFTNESRVRKYYPGE